MQLLEKIAEVLVTSLVTPPEAKNNVHKTLLTLIYSLGNIVKLNCTLLYSVVAALRDIDHIR